MPDAQRWLGAQTLERRDQLSVALFGAGPGGLPVTSPSPPIASYQMSHRWIALRSTPNSTAISTTRRPWIYPSTARPRHQRSRSFVLSAARMNRRSFLRADDDLPHALIASPVLERATITSVMIGAS